MDAHSRKLINALIVRENGYNQGDPDDPGGPTKYGITADTLGEWLGLRGPAPAQLVEDMTMATAERIYWEKWMMHRKLNLLELPTAIREAVFDASVLFGRARAAKWVQHIVNVDEDGIIGGITILAVSNYFTTHSLSRFLKTYAKLRIERHFARVAEAPNQIKYLKGWVLRAVELT